jgi:hypothetical protein
MEVSEQKLETPGLVHPILTEEQAGLVHQALIAALNAPPESYSADEDEEQRVRNQFSELVYFFAEVVDHPEAFGVRSALEVKRMLRGMKPKRGKPLNKRKRRQRTRPSWEKRTNAQKRAEAEEFNRARQIMEDEAKEAEAANNEEQLRRIERFNELIVKDELRTEEFQEALELLGYENISEAVRLRRAEDTPEARIAAAAAKAERENDPLE